MSIVNLSKGLFVFPRRRRPISLPLFLPLPLLFPFLSSLFSSHFSCSSASRGGSSSSSRGWNQGQLHRSGHIRDVLSTCCTRCPAYNPPLYATACCTRVGRSLAYVWYTFVSCLPAAVVWRSTLMHSQPPLHHCRPGSRYGDSPALCALVCVCVCACIVVYG